MFRCLFLISTLCVFWSGNAIDGPQEINEDPNEAADRRRELEQQDETERFLEEQAKKLDELIDFEVMQQLPYTEDEIRENAYQEVMEEDLTPPGRVYRYRNLTQHELEESSLNKMYWIDRTKLNLVSAPTVELGLWNAVAKTYEIVKAKFTKRFMDWRGARVVDRRIIRRLKRIADNGCSLFPSETRQDTKINPEHLAVVHHAQVLIWAILKVYPVRGYFVSSSTKANDLKDWSPSSLTTYFDSGDTIGNPGCEIRFNTLSNIGLPRQFEWGSMNYYDVLEAGLFELDQYDPFDFALSPLLRQFDPVNRNRDNSIRSWKVADPTDFNTVTDLIAKCMTYA